MLGDTDLGNRPRLTTVVRRQITSDALALGLCLLVVGVRGVHGDGDVDPS